jgi:hypothetical protein
MQKLFRSTIAILTFVFGTLYLSYITRIHELKQEGYTQEASETIAKVEFHFKDADANYYGLIED